MRFAVGLAIVVLGVGTSACVSAPTAAVQGGPVVALAPHALPHLRVRNINSTTARLYNVDLGPGFGPALAEQLAACLTGSRLVDLRLHIEQPDRERLITTYEFTDPLRDDAVIGRYRRSTPYITPLVEYRVDGARKSGPEVDAGAQLGGDLCLAVTGGA